MVTRIGIDIGSYSIKLIEIARDGDRVGLVAAGSVPMPSKAMTSTLQADAEAVAVAIRQLMKDTGTKSRDVTIALPESKVFTRVIEVPQLSQRELSSAIKWEAEQYIPLPLDQVNVDYAILRDAKETGTNKMEVLLVAAPKSLVDRYMTILEMAELNPIGAETEIIATSRAVARSLPNVKTVMIVSLGAQTSDIAVLKGGVLVFTRSVSSGGEAITRAIAQSLEFTQSQAEEYKRTYGLQKDKLEGKIAMAAKPIMDTIVGEMKRAIAYYEEKYKDQHVETVLLTGGTSRIPGMVVYLAQAINFEVQFANPWAGIAKDARFNVLNTEGPNFCVAVGLALRE
jgi:type IV pilus assembly protein PilM